MSLLIDKNILVCSGLRLLTRQAVESEKYDWRTLNAESGGIILLCLPCFALWNSNKDLSRKRNELWLYVESFLLSHYPFAFSLSQTMTSSSLFNSSEFQPLDPTQEPIFPPELMVSSFKKKQQWFVGFVVLYKVWGTLSWGNGRGKMAASKRKCMGMNPSLFYKTEGVSARVV